MNEAHLQLYVADKLVVLRVKVIVECVDTFQDAVQHWDCNKYKLFAEIDR